MLNTFFLWKMSQNEQIAQKKHFTMSQKSCYQKWVNKVGDLKMCTEKLYTRNKKMWKKIWPQTLWVWLWFLWLECNYKQLYDMHNVYLFFQVIAINLLSFIVELLHFLHVCDLMSDLVCERGNQISSKNYALSI